MIPYEVLTEALEANRRGGQGVCYLESGQAERSVSYRSLYGRALGILYTLQRAGLAPGDELALLVNTNEQLVDVFWACLVGGIVPVPVGVGIADQHRHRLFRIFPRLARPYVYTDRDNLDRLGSFAEMNDASAVFAEIKRKSVLLDEITDISHPGVPHPARPDDTAFIQFSSGSTAEPRGVVLTHRNLLSNIAGIIEGAEMRETDSTFSWMPLTHDMGLIGFHLTPLVMNLNATQMSTELFIRRPLSWLHEAAARRATLLSSPNFGYRHFLRSFKPEKLEGAQLSSVRLIFNGAEPISADLCEEFLTTLSPFGLRPAAMFPVYGLAEASLAVSFPRPGESLRVLTLDRHALRSDEAVTFVDESDTDALRVVSVGRPIKGCRLRVADDRDEELPESCLGHVQIAGANVTSGYYRDDGANQEAFTADGWLDTGDLGFVADGELIITGREKDVIVVNGQNYYPQDIEAAAAATDGLEIGKVAAGGLRAPQGETDAVVVFVMHRAGAEQFLPVAHSVRRRVQEQVGLEIADVVPVARLPKTTSGKLQRYQLVQAYVAGEYRESLAELSRLAATSDARSAGVRSDIEHALISIWRSYVKDQNIGPHDSFFEFGTSSLTLAQIYARIDETYPGCLEIADLFDHPTAAQLAEFLERKVAESVDA